jgi:hypothetical protein
MTMPIDIIELDPDPPHLHGATLAQRHLSDVLPALRALNGEPAIFLLDLSKATSVTGSYLRGTVYWALLCGQAEAAESTAPASADKWAVRPLPLFPAVVGGSTEVIDDVNDFFQARNLAILQVTERSKSAFKSARLLGALDRHLASTLSSLAQLGEATAGDLAAKSSESITVNAWSNRLGDLYSLRLVTRRRDGKFWQYSPLALEIQTWG